MGGNDQRCLFLRWCKEHCYVNQFLAPVDENWHTPPSLCALACHKGWEHHNVNAHLTLPMTPLHLIKILAIFGPVIAEFSRRICTRLATH